MKTLIELIVYCLLLYATVTFIEYVISTELQEKFRQFKDKHPLKHLHWN